jgi:hypothetical protein
MNLFSENIYVIIHIGFLLSIFWIAAIYGIEKSYEIGKKPQDGLKIVRNKNGRVGVRIEWPFVIIYSLFTVIYITILGGFALLIQDGLYELSNWIFKTSIASKLGYSEEYVVALFYGLIMAWGYYSGKAWACYFLANQILICINKRTPLQHPEKDISVLKVLEENMRREESH